MARQRELVGGGRLIMEEAEGRVHFVATRPQDQRGLYKVWICGGGGRMLLGTMIPQDNHLHLERTISRNALAQAGCYPVLGGEAVMAFAFQGGGQSKSRVQPLPEGWQKTAHPGERLEEGILRGAVEGRTALIREDGEGFQLAIPYQLGQEFPLTPLFCLARWGELGGERYLIWKFDGRGRPILWNKI